MCGSQNELCVVRGLMFLVTLWWMCRLQGKCQVPERSGPLQTEELSILKLEQLSTGLNNLQICFVFLSEFYLLKQEIKKLKALVAFTKRFMCTNVCIHVCSLHTCIVYLEVRSEHCLLWDVVRLGMAVTHLWVLGIEPASPARAHTLNHLSTSPQGCSL